MKQRLAELLKESGFDRVGVCEPGVGEAGARLIDWVDQGRNGGMAWMRRTLETRLDIQRLLPGTESIVMVAKPYAQGRFDPSRAAGSDRLAPVARFARGADYHLTVEAGLKPAVDLLEAEGHRARVFCDALPVMEKHYAWKAGLGGMGRHTLLVVPGFGSWVVLGGIATSARLEPDDPGPTTEELCGGCRLCIRKCPMSALRPEGSLDALLCLSYWNIEAHAPVIPSDVGRVLSGQVYGCDICQDVCPLNGIGGEPAIRVPQSPTVEQLGRFVGLDRDAFRSEVRGTVLERLGQDRLRRNLEAAGLLSGSAGPGDLGVGGELQ